MVQTLVNGFVDEKLRHRREALGLYRIAASVGGDLIANRFRLRCEAAIQAMLETAPLGVLAKPDYMARMIFLNHGWSVARSHGDGRTAQGRL